MTDWTGSGRSIADIRKDYTQAGPTIVVKLSRDVTS